MTLRQFVLVLDEVGDQRLAALFGRCDDVTVSVVDGRIEAAFDRDAPSLVDAIVSGVRDLDIVGLNAVEAEPDDDLVTISTVAERLVRNPAAVERWMSGEVGPGGFPAPVDWATPVDVQPCYSWSQVAPWLARNIGYLEPDVMPSYMAVNLALRLRALAPHVERIAAVRSLIPG
jgi:hypothetical protein